MIEDLDDLTDQLESLKVEQEDGAGKDGEEDMERSWGEERRQLEDDLVKVSAKLEAVRVRQWVRKKKEKSGWEKFAWLTAGQQLRCTRSTRARRPHTERKSEKVFVTRQNNSSFSLR